MKNNNKNTKWKKKCKTQQNEIIIASINTTKNIALYSEYIPSTRA